MDRRILLLAALFLTPLSTNAAGDAAIDRATLKGLKGVGVVVDEVDPQLVQLGLTRDAVLDHASKRLTARHLTVDPAATEFLGLRILAVRSGRGPLALSITLGLYQPVLLSRDHDIKTSTQTWEVATVVLADPKIFLTAFNESADELVDSFARAYLAVNPE